MRISSKRRITVLAAALFVLLSALTAPVAAQPDEAGTDWLCGSDSTLVTVILNLMTVLIVAGPLAGIVMAIFFTTADTANPGKDNYSDDRRNVLIAGALVPIGVYGAELLLDVLFGFNISCIIP